MHTLTETSNKKGATIKMNKIIFIMGILILSLAAVSLNSCSQTPAAYSTATLTHAGFDFTTGIQTQEAGKYDGEVIAWNPDRPGTYITTIEGTSYPNGDYLWWRASSPLDAVPHQKHIGTVALSTITSAPATWDSGSGIYPLLVGHSYVVKCTPEGYAKFNVTAVGTSAEWTANVQYYFSKSSGFDK